MAVAKVLKFAVRRRGLVALSLFWFPASVLILPSCQYVKRLRNKISEKRPDSKPAIGGKTASYFAVSYGTLLREQQWRGLIFAARRVEVRSERRLKISRVYVKNDTWIKAGTLIAEVDNKESEKRIRESKDRVAALRIEVKSAEIAMEYAKRTFDRKAALLKGNVIAKKEFDEVDKQLQISQTGLQSKRLEFEKTQRDLQELDLQTKSASFRAPFDGFVSNVIAVSANSEELNQGTLIAVVANPTEFTFYMEVDEGEVTQLRVAMPVILKLDALPRPMTNAKIAEIPSSPMVDQGAVTKKFKIAVSFSVDDEQRKQLKEGFEGQVRVVFERRDRALTIPLAAAFIADGRDFALVATRKGGAISQRRVSFGLRTSDEVEVLEGIKEGEFVAIQGE